MRGTQQSESGVKEKENQEGGGEPRGSDTKLVQKEGSYPPARAANSWSESQCKPDHWLAMCRFPVTSERASTMEQRGHISMLIQDMQERKWSQLYKELLCRVGGDVDMASLCG